MYRLWLIILLVLAPVSAHATLYWDDELSTFTGTYGEISPSVFSSFPPGGDGFTLDTNIKYSGSTSLRYNYQAICQTTTGGQPCGGWSDRSFPYGNEHYGRIYLRVSQDFEWGAVNGQTKIFGVRSTTGNSKLWFNFYFGLGMIVSAENTPADGSTTNYSINMSMPREQWVCFEWHYKANTPGVANGTLETWKEGVRTVSRQDIPWRGSTNNSYLDYIRFYRQTAFGNLWFDRIAVGNTRIGCVGSPPLQDTTNPSVGTNLVVQ